MVELVPGKRIEWEADDGCLPKEENGVFFSIPIATCQRFFYFVFMPPKNMMRRWTWLPLLLAACGTGFLFAQEPTPKIVFLHLKLDGKQVSLISSAVVPGTLKKSSENHPAIDLEVVTSAGQVLWTNTVANPSIRHLEYEDPDHPGQIISKEVQLTNTEFMVRIPAVQDAHQVNFYLSQPAVGTNAPESKSLNLPAGQRESLGSVMLPAETK